MLYAPNRAAFKLFLAIFPQRLRISLGNVFQSPYQYQKLILMSETAFSLIPNYQKSTIRKSESSSSSSSSSYYYYYYFETVPKGKT